MHSNNDHIYLFPRTNQNKKNQTHVEPHPATYRTVVVGKVSTYVLDGDT